MPYFSPKDVEAKKSCPKRFICPLLFVYENRAFLIGQNKSHDYAYKYHSTNLRETKSYSLETILRYLIFNIFDYIQSRQLVFFKDIRFQPIQISY